MTKPTRGLLFTHAKMLDQSGRPIEMRVTAVRGGQVYYCGVDGMGSWRCDVDRFAEKILAAKEVQ